jgi:thermitase
MRGKANMMRLLVMGLMAGLVTSLILCLLVFGNPVNSAGPENKPEYASDHILVKFRSDFSSSAVQSFHTQQEASIIKEFNPLNVQVVSVPEGEVREKIEVYRNNPDVLFAEPDYVLTADKEPNDPGYSSQWGLAAVQAAQAWDIAPGNSNTLIAILDTGIDQDHEDLSSKIIGNINFSSAADYDDHFGHGTHVAGIAAAVTNNGTGVAGLGCNAGLLNVKVLDDTGSGLDSGVADGIIWAVDNGAKVINLSLGGDNYSSTLETAVNYAWGKGAVVVAAAGNTGTNSYRYPAYYANCLAVAASDQGDTLASFSTWGDWVDVAAPGPNLFYISESPA